MSLDKLWPLVQLCGSSHYCAMSMPFLIQVGVGVRGGSCKGGGHLGV